jgi:hypothetical protein
VAAFNRDFSVNALIRTLIGIAAWSGFNVCILLWIRHLDHGFMLSENALSAMLIPIGLIEAAVFVRAFLLLKNRWWKSLLISVASIANFVFFLVVLQSLHSQSGPL